MKAIVYKKYGTPDVLELKEIKTPVPKVNEVLVKVHASSINSWDWDMVKGTPKIYRLLFGLFKPKYNIIGCDIAGRVESIGRNVEKFQVGDEVFGDVSACGFGAFAEYKCVPENLLALKPTKATFEEAAAIPQGGVLALQALQSNGAISSGQKILINGAGGSTGPFALQMAKMYDAEVTCVDSGIKLEMLLSLGADHVIDYTKENYTKNGIQYDLIIDLMAHHSIFDYKRALAPNGTFMMVGGSVGCILQAVFIGPIISRYTNKKMKILGHKANDKDLNTLAKLFDDGTIKSIIGKTFPLKDVLEAMRFFSEGNTKGKVIITM